MHSASSGFCVEVTNRLADLIIVHEIDDKAKLLDSTIDVFGRLLFVDASPVVTKFVLDAADDIAAELL